MKWFLGRFEEVSSQNQLITETKSGAKGGGLGRSRGGFSTKINLKSNGPGLPVAVVLTGGQVSDVKGMAGAGRART